MADKKSSTKETKSIASRVDPVEFKDLALLKFNQLEVATNNFSNINKLGEGGFGPVYKVNGFYWNIIFCQHTKRILS